MAYVVQIIPISKTSPRQRTFVSKSGGDLARKLELVYHSLGLQIDRTWTK